MNPAELHNVVSQTLQERKADFEQDIKPAYETYIHSVSEKDVCSSLQTCVMLMTLCAAFPAGRVMDLGSGISSYVLRLYKQQYQPGLTVHSIDTDAYWLNKSRDFVAQHGLDTEGFYLWDEAGELQEPCGLIFLDIQDYPKRQEFLPKILGRFCTPRTNILMDDMHWPRYRHAVSEFLWQRDFVHLSLEKETRDEFGRYAGLICGLSGE